MADRRIELVNRRAVVTVSGASLIAPLVQRKVEEVTAPDVASVAADRAVVENALQQIQDIASGAPDAPSVLNKLDKDADLSDLTDKEAATSNLLFLQSGAGAEARSIRDKLREIVSAADFGATGSGADETANVQLAIDSLPARGGTVHVPPGVKFSLRALTFPARSNLEYWADDDIDTFFAGGDIGTNERVYYSANSSYPEDPTGAVVNEWRFTGAFHPGIILDVRKDIAGHDAFMRPGQDRIEPARGSVMIHDEQVGVWSLTYEKYGSTYSPISGVSQFGYRRVQTLHGITAASWPSPPALNDRISGDNGRPGSRYAAGYFLGYDGSGNTVVEWITGRFAGDQTVTNETQAVVATNIMTADSTDASKTLPKLTHSLRTGYWGIDLPPDRNRSSLGIGGDLSLTPTVTYGQHVEQTITNAGVRWYRNISSLPNAGASVRLATGESDKRLWVYDDPEEGGAPRGMLGAVCAAVTFGASMAIGNNSINVESITKLAPGNYEITFKREMASASYQPTVSMSSLMSRPSGGATFYTVGYETFGDATKCQVRVSLVDLAANTVTAADIPAACTVSFLITGGDI